MTSTSADKGATTPETASTEQVATESTQVPAATNTTDTSATPKTDNDSSSSSTTATTATTNDQDTTTATSTATGAPQSLQAFTAAVFSGGFNPPKINTSSFFSSMRSTLSNTKPPTLPAGLVAPQINKVDMKNLQASTEQLANTTKDWGVSAFKSLSSAAQRVSANVTQGIQKEHEEFLKQKKLENVLPHQGTEAVPAWTGLPDEDQFKSRILSLSKDKRNFLLPPPPGTDFIFDMKVYSSTAMATLKEDPNLDKMRFYLVPKEIEELVFWRNYFYRVTLLKQVALSGAAAGTDSFSEGFSDSSSTTSTTTAEGGESGNARHTRTLSSSALGYNIYFGKDDIQGPPSRSRPTSTTVKDLNLSLTTTTTATKESGKAAIKKKPEVLFEAEMPDHEEDPDAWLEKQLASGVSIGDDDDADVDVADWEKELQNELKDYVEGS
ncbi:Synapse-associated protein 1 [Mortierella sp. GBA35]|nr:Synapse-associated protein 1 [Mortierella sp. GBA35]